MAMRSIIGSRTKQCYPKFLAKRLFEDTTLMTAFSHPDLNNNHNMNDEIQSHETTEGGNLAALRSNYGRQTLTHHNSFNSDNAFILSFSTGVPFPVFASKEASRVRLLR